jgi:hypothetical protein
MADVLKVLGQSAPAATTESNLYEVPFGASAIVSTLSVCNRAATVATFRISVDVGGSGTGVEDYIYYDQQIQGNDNFSVTAGFSLFAGDIVKVYASSANLSFSAFGVERT